MMRNAEDLRFAALYTPCPRLRLGRVRGKALYIHAGIGCRANDLPTHRLLRAGRGSRRSGFAGRGSRRSPARSVGGPLWAAAGAFYIPRSALRRDERPRDFGSTLSTELG